MSEHFKVITEAANDAKNRNYTIAIKKLKDLLERMEKCDETANVIDLATILIDDYESKSMFFDYFIDIIDIFGQILGRYMHYAFRYTI